MIFRILFEYIVNDNLKNNKTDRKFIIFIICFLKINANTVSLEKILIFLLYDSL